MTPYNKDGLFFKRQQLLMHRLNLAYHMLLDMQVSMNNLWLMIRLSANLFNHSLK